MDYLPPDPFQDEYTKRPRRPLRGSLYEKNLVAEASVDQIDDDDLLIRGPGQLGERSKSVVTFTQVPLRRASRQPHHITDQVLPQPQQKPKFHWLSETLTLLLIGIAGAVAYFGIVKYTGRIHAMSILGDSSTLDNTCDAAAIHALPPMYVSCVCEQKSYQPTHKIKEEYDGLKGTFIPNFLPEIPELHDLSCDAANVALYWLSQYVQLEIDFNMNDWRLQFLLVTFYVHHKGHLWENSSGWLSNEVHFCSWKGVICSGTNDTIIGLELPNILNGHQPIPLPEELFLLTNLKLIDFANSSIGGEFPSGLYNLTDLVYLDLHHNHLTGSIGSELARLSNLRVLNLNDAGQNGKLKFELTNEFSQLTYLEELYLSNLSAVGTLPAEIQSLTDIQYLDMKNCGFSGTLPSELGLLTKLQYLNLGGSSFSSSIPDLSRLQKLGETRWHHNSTVSLTSSPI